MCVYTCYRPKHGASPSLPVKTEFVDQQDKFEAIIYSGVIMPGSPPVSDNTSGRKLADEEVYRLNRAYRAINSCNQALLHSNNEKELLQEICNIIVETGGYRMAWVGYAEHDDSQSIRSVAHAGLGDDYFKTLKISWGDNLYGQGPVGTAIRTAKPCFSHNVQEDPKFELWRKEAIKQGFAAVHSLPLLIDNQVFGALTIYSAVPYAFNDKEVEFLLSLAENLAYGITTLRSRESQKKAEKKLKASEKRFRTLFESHSVVMLLLEPDTGNIIDANYAAASFYGWPIEQLRMMRIQEIATIKPEEVNTNLRKAHTSEQNQFLFRHQRHDKSFRDVEVFLSKIEIDGKEFLYSINHDVTDRKRAERYLENLHVFLLQQNPAIIIITDPLGNIEYVNPAFTKITGYTSEEVRGANPRILKSGLMPQEIYTNLWQTILSGGVWSGEMQNKKKNGDLYWDKAVITAIINDEGVITNYLSVKIDITEQKKLFYELTSAKAKAEESNRFKTAFLANVSHEVRTPIHGILGFAELLQDPDVLKDEQLQYIRLIQQTGQRMLNLVNDLIDISRIEAGEVKLDIAETQINNLLRDIHAFFKPQARKKALQLSCITGLTDIESVLETDSLKVNQIMTNFIQNAMKFTKTGTIEFGYTRKDNMLEFYCADSGIGIPLDMKDKIFDRFQQVDNASTQYSEGAGLGLNISRALVALLGGNIGLESIEGKGSRFFFTLPYNHSSSSKTTIPAPLIKEQEKSALSVTLLITEDDRVSSILMREMLKKDIVTVYSAKNGHEAVEMVSNYPDINIVLMDINMPVMNGYDATRQIKQLRPDLPVICQTANISKDDKIKARDAGCDGFITKPVNKKDLLEVIAELLDN